MSERDERFQDFGDTISGRASEVRGHLLGPGRRFLGGQGGADNFELLRQLPWPGLALHWRFGRNNQLALLCRRGEIELELRSQPADLATPFLFGALAIEVNQTGEEVIVADVSGPPICGENGAIEVVVQALEYADEAAIMNVAFGSS
jgi:hypothetical protein